MYFISFPLTNLIKINTACWVNTKNMKSTWLNIVSFKECAWSCQLLLIFFLAHAFIYCSYFYKCLFSYSIQLSVVDHQSLKLQAMINMLPWETDVELIQSSSSLQKTHFCFLLKMVNIQNKTKRTDNVRLKILKYLTKPDHSGGGNVIVNISHLTCIT